MAIEKTRIAKFADKIITKPTEEFGAEVAEWLGGGKEVPKRKSPSKERDVKKEYRDLLSLQGDVSEADIQALRACYELPRTMPIEERLDLLKQAIESGGFYSEAKKKIYSDNALDFLQDYESADWEGDLGGQA